MADVLQIVGSIAGIGGISLGVLLYLYRDIIGRKIFPTLSSSQATMLLGAMIVLAFAVAILGIFAGLAAGEGAFPFIVLVAIVLAFIIAVLLIATRRFSARRPAGPDIPPERELYVRISGMIGKNRLDDADRELSRAASVHQGNAESWYWRSRIALARGNVDVAINYVDEALKRDDRNQHIVALQIKLLLLSGKRGDRTKAKARAEQSHGIGSALDAWLTCLKAEGMFGPGVRSATELDAKCVFPEPLISKDVSKDSAR